MRPGGRSGREVLPGIYTDIQLLRHGFFYINADSKLGLVDPSGKVLVQPAYKGA
ncbi:MAG: WG repeat-containing protein [Saprospirales bacterium]|nr:WG repeat-containing protein [Saprospirales bacterium]